MADLVKQIARLNEQGHPCQRRHSKPAAVLGQNLSANQRSNKSLLFSGEPENPRGLDATRAVRIWSSERGDRVNLRTGGNL